MTARPKQSKAEAYQRVEAILEQGPFVPGTRAVHRGHFLYTLRWSQAGARISEMNDLGWKIASVNLPESKWDNGIRTAYRLDSKPLTVKSVSTSKSQSSKPSVQSDYERREREECDRAMPLFAERER